ncbi:quinone oxidoreductase family protein [Metabacillus hrfriensis]|uniref:NADPH:quinone oxidoreductase family protein n=1 Tax=Metabacillus hrfriensis TaxID=3048891 RepID=A0ACD4R5V5_9BACI|nr:NADPH:quinone oxidoreductase family protein [Metabacillus sp. CT-WN-B3]USK30872.1 NADPH:quinone oxidoreductase family protein [Bacillus sp. CMF21]WHZ55585.1 NADPH:quinone oxidoreductase family protein [Metabacillus sp. CT-WN-B3]
MKAIQFKEYGKPDVLRVVDVPVPPLKAGGVLIKVKAAGVNFADTARRYGQYLAKTPLPYIPGAEVAGIVAEVSPEVTNFKPGDRVVALTEDGGYAEIASLDQSQLVKIPDQVDFNQAASILGQGLSAYHILKTSGQIKKGETVLVHAAAGGVGTLAVQLAKLMGAGAVIATASSSEKLKLAVSLGADDGINYTEDNWHKKVLSSTGGKGTDIILEMVGGDIFKNSLKCMAPNGRLVIYGRAGGKETLFDPAVLMQRNISVVGFWLVHILKNPQLYKESVEELLQYIGEGKLQLVIGGALPLEEAKRAHELLEGRMTKGKLVLNP